MIEKITHIKNPLTVIAIFSAVAEISGTTILPFISTENQSTYIWFLMLFPTLLVIIFFITLNFNHKVLYAPSDYKNETNFLRSFRSATAQEKIEKLKEEIEETEAVEGTGVDSATVMADASITAGATVVAEAAVIEAVKKEDAPASPTTPREIKLDLNSLPASHGRTNEERQIDVMANYTLAEKLSILKLSKDLDLDFKNDVRFNANGSRPYIFDALAVKSNEIHGIDVKLVLGNLPNIKALFGSLEKMELAILKIKNETSKDFILHYVLVLDKSPINKESFIKDLAYSIIDYPFKVKIHVFTLSDLINEYQFGS